ncbi:MAG TPA: hypothetical protein VGQ41_18775 [Pyrinomonadaceae bacterium]|jgi:hypothetical protein|nr:hypothetical protein [Pyrinomonadaceae bacterium]
MANDGRVGFLALIKHLAMKFTSESPNTLLQRTERDITVLEGHGCLYLIWQIGTEEKPVLWPERTTLQFNELFRLDETSKQWKVEPRERAFTDLILQLTQGGVEALDLIAAQSSEPTPIWRPKEDS